jgi:hypothetical protein
MHIGIPHAADPADIEWTPHTARDPVVAVRRRQQRGGFPTCPQVRMATADSPERVAFLAAVRAMYHLQ